VRLAVEVADQARPGDGPGPAAHELPLSVHRDDPLQPGLRAAGGPQPHAHPPRPVVGAPVRVGAAGGRLDRVAGVQGALDAAALDPHAPLDHLVPLALAGVDVGRRDEALRPADHVELEQRTAALLRRRPELDLHSEARSVQHFARLGHRRSTSALFRGASRQLWRTSPPPGSRWRAHYCSCCTPS